MSDARWKSLSGVVRERFTEENIRKCIKRLKTGCAGLDKLLGGGIYPGLIVLGGSPNLGKSTFAIQISETISTQTPVLYFSMEMTKERIASKLISRYLFLNRKELCLNEDQCLSSDKLIDGMPAQDPWEPEVLRAIEQARIHEERVLENLFVVEEPLSAAGIVETVEEFIRQHGDLPSSPMVVVDYLQILPTSGTRNWNEKQAVEESLKYMVRLVHKDIPVILISSLSRGSYKSPMEISSFKETGGIEYSADVLLGLQFQACREKNMDLSAEKGKVPREVELFLLKQRYGRSDCGVRLRYYSANDCFLEEPAQMAAAQDGADGCQPWGADIETPACFLVSEEWISPAAPEPEVPEVPEVPEAREVPEMPKLGEPEEKDHLIPKAVMCNTKIAKELRQGAYGIGNRCHVFRGVYTEYDLLPISGEDGQGPWSLSCFDCDVADAVYTLLSKYGRDSFSAGQVLRSLSGDKRQTLTEQKKQRIVGSIERMRNLFISIRCEEEMRQREAGKPQPEIKSFQGPFLHVREENGRYFFDRSEGPVMPLYAYGEKTSQMISFPMNLLQVQAGRRKLSDTEETICVKRYIIRRLEILRHKQKTGSSGFQVISFQEDRDMAALLRLYEGLSSRESRAQKRRKLRGTVLQILGYYKEIGYIEDYQESSHGVKILKKVRDPWKLPAIRPSPSGRSADMEGNQ